MTQDFFETTCLVCRTRFLTDGEPVCSDPVCQAIFGRESEVAATIAEAQAILQDAFDDMTFEDLGL